MNASTDTALAAHSQAALPPAAPAHACYVRWQHADACRYYELRLMRNLFGDYELLRTWGGIGSSRGGQRADPLHDEAAGVEAMSAIARRRLQRGYALTRVAGLPAARPETNDSPTP